MLAKMYAGTAGCMQDLLFPEILLLNMMLDAVRAILQASTTAYPSPDAKSLLEGSLPALIAIESSIILNYIQVLL